MDPETAEPYGWPHLAELLGPTLGEVIVADLRAALDLPRQGVADE
jgi:hypothetical protein